MSCRNLSVKICIDQSNKVKTSDKQMHVAFCDNNGYCQISSDKLERRSDNLIRVRSIQNKRQLHVGMNGHGDRYLLLY